MNKHDSWDHEHIGYAKENRGLSSNVAAIWMQIHDHIDKYFAKMYNSTLNYEYQWKKLYIELVLICMLFGNCGRHVLKGQKFGYGPDHEENTIEEAKG